MRRSPALSNSLDADDGHAHSFSSTARLLDCLDRPRLVPQRCGRTPRRPRAARPRGTWSRWLIRALATTAPSATAPTWRTWSAVEMPKPIASGRSVWRADAARCRSASSSAELVAGAGDAGQRDAVDEAARPLGDVGDPLRRSWSGRAGRSGRDRARGRRRRNSSLSSVGRSGTMKPSTPAAAQSAREAAPARTAGSGCSSP